MTKRECLLSAVFVGPPLKLGDKELTLPFGRFEILKMIDNVVFGTNSKRKQTEIGAIYECAWIMSLSKSEMIDLMASDEEARTAALARFCIEHEDELPDIKHGIVARLEALKAAMIESDTPGKEDARHAS